MSRPPISRDQPRNSCCCRGNLKKRPHGGVVNFPAAQTSIATQQNYRNSDAANVLREGVHLVGANGERSSRAASGAATRLFVGDLLSTIFFMNKIHTWLDGQTPLERAEQSEEGLEFGIDMIGAIEAGVYI